MSADTSSPRDPLFGWWRPEFDTLATYNSECRRGIVHTPEWDARMSELQAEYERSIRAAAEAVPGAIISDEAIILPAPPHGGWLNAMLPQLIGDLNDAWLAILLVIVVCVASTAIHFL